MKKYKIKFNIKIEEIPEGENCNSVDAVDSECSRYISESEASSIDAVEKNILETGFSAMRDAISSHLTEISKKKP